MKIKIIKEVIEEVEVTFPAYRKFGMYTFFKVLNEKEAIKVVIRPDEFEIQRSPYYVATAFDKEHSSESTEKDFNDAIILCLMEAKTWNKL